MNVGLVGIEVGMAAASVIGLACVVVDLLRSVGRGS